MSLELYKLAVITGIAAGGIYALVAVGITQVFAVTRVLNFAQAGFAIWGAFLYAWLVNDHSWPVVWAAVVAVLAVALMGTVSDLLVSRLARHASTVSKILLTFGLLQLLTAVAFWRFGRFARTAVHLFPPGGFTIWGARVTWTQVGILVAVTVIVAGFECFLRFTKLGLHTRAIAEDPTIAELQGTLKGPVGVLNWTIAAAIGGLAGVLTASLQAFEAYTFLAVFLLALVASLIGGLNSLIVTAVGGLGLGIALQVTTVASSVIGIGPLVVFIGVVAYVLARRHWPADVAKITWSRPVTGHGVRWWWATVIVFVLGWVWLVAGVFAADLWGQIGALILIYVVLTMSFVPLLGWTSQISVAQGGLMALGAYAFVTMLNEHGWPLVPAVAVGVIAGAVGGAVVGLICQRLSFVQSAIVTLAFTTMITSWLLLTGFFDTRVGRLELRSNFLGTGRGLFWAFAVVALAVAYMLGNARRSQWGIRFSAVRTAPDMARHFGVSSARNRVIAFALSGGIAGLGGVMFIFFLRTTESTTFGVGLSLGLLLTAILSGTGGVGGAFLGPLLILGLPQVVNGSPSSGPSIGSDIIAGVGTILFMARKPNGLLTFATPTDAQRERLRRKVASLIGRPLTDN